MGKILTYKDIEEKGGTINRWNTTPPGELHPKIYEGDTHCPASSDWWRITNVACPYSADDKRCTDKATIALSSPAYFGYAWSDSMSGGTRNVDNCTVTFPDGYNYKISYSGASSLAMKVNTTGYNDIVLQYGSNNLKLIAPQNLDGSYSIKKISIKFDKTTTGTFQAFYGYYYTISSRNYINNFTPIGFSQMINTPTDTISKSGIVIPKMPTDRIYNGVILVIGNPSEFKS